MKKIQLGLSLAILIFLVHTASAQTFSVIHKFVGQYVDGATPYGGLVEDPKGNLYGMTASGGASNCGTIFKIVGQKTEKPILSFPIGVNDSCPGPVSGPIRDSAGEIYGTSPQGEFGPGQVFKLTPSDQLDYLYTFCSDQCLDGSIPYDTPLRDAEGNIFGTTMKGGDDSNQPPCYLLGCGVVFEVDPSGNETVLYTFLGGTDGGTPVANLIEDNNGDFYGTTELGGIVNQACAAGCGVVFKLTSAGQETVLYTFTGGLDGLEPTSGLTRDPAGNLYGTTTGGGKYLGGTVFKLTSQGVFSVLHAFGNGSDGAVPYAGVIRDSAGDLYGTTVLGGNSGCGSSTCGTVFEISAQGKETVLHRFAALEGSNPFDPLWLDATGTLFGTTSSGGGSCGNTNEGNCGSVFKIIL